MNGNSPFWTAFGISSAIANHRSNKKMARDIQQANENNKGVIQYEPSPIEAFFLETEPLSGVALSGGTASWRIRAIARVVECGLQQGYIPIILHCQNYGLENYLSQNFNPSNLVYMNASNPIYDPFVGLSNAEIDRLILSSSLKGQEIKPVGKYYLDGISNYIRAKSKHPAAYMFIACPHLTLIDEIHDAESKGVISSATARTILSQLLQGEIERGNIEGFFSVFGQQSKSILADKRTIANATSVRQTVQNRQLFSADLISGSNIILLNMLLSEMQELLADGTRLMLVMDGVSIASNTLVQNLVQQSGTNLAMVISSDDVFSAFGGVEKDFFSFMGKTSKIAISRHASAYSCQKWSDTIGSYDKLEVSNTIANNMNYLGQVSFGSTNTANVNIKRENIVKPEAIARMDMQEVYVVSRSVGEISHTYVV